MELREVGSIQGVGPIRTEGKRLLSIGANVQVTVRNFISLILSKQDLILILYILNFLLHSINLILIILFVILLNRIV